MREFPIYQKAHGREGSTLTGPDHYELFDLVADPSEKHDLAAEHVERVKAFKQAYSEWFDDVTQGLETTH